MPLILAVEPEGLGATVLWLPCPNLETFLTAHYAREVMALRKMDDSDSESHDEVAAM